MAQELQEEEAWLKGSMQVQAELSSILGKFQGPAWLRSSRYRDELSSILGRFQGPAWLRRTRYRSQDFQVQG